MANPTCALIGSFSVRILQYNGPFSMETVQSVYVCFGAKLANIQNLQPKQRKKRVNIAILLIETTRRSQKDWNFSDISKMDKEDEHF